MKKIEYDSLSKKEKNKLWLQSIKKTTLKNWEKKFDALNTLELSGLDKLDYGIDDTQINSIKKAYQRSIKKYFKPFIKSLIKDIKS